MLSQIQADQQQQLRPAGSEASKIQLIPTSGGGSPDSSSSGVLLSSPSSLLHQPPTKNVNENLDEDGDDLQEVMPQERGDVADVEGGDHKKNLEDDSVEGVGSEKEDGETDKNEEGASADTVGGLTPKIPTDNKAAANPPLLTTPLLPPVVPTFPTPTLTPASPAPASPAPSSTPAAKDGDGSKEKNVAVSALDPKKAEGDKA